MLLVFSHVLAFSVLFVAAVWDLKTTEVPDFLSVIGVAGGILLHAAFSFLNGSFDPLLWSLGVGAVFSVLGWSLYFAGGWGGADAFAMSVLGFAAPYVPGDPSIIFSLNLLVNVMVVGFVYTLGFALYQAFTSESVFRDTFDRIKSNEKRVTLEIIAAVIISVLVEFTGRFSGFIYFSGLLVLIFLYRFLKVIENSAMKREVKTENLEGGEVPVKGQGLGGKVKGLTEEDIRSIDSETVRVKSGVRFVPVFPVALVITEVFGFGMMFLVSLG